MNTKKMLNAIRPYPSGIAFMGFMIIGLVAMIEMDLPAQVLSEEQPVQSNMTPFISDLKAMDVGLTALTLSWAPVEDQAEVASFEIYQGTLQMATVQENVNVYSITGLKANTWYQFDVKACDASGNCGSGPVIGVKTLAVQETVESTVNEVNDLVSAGVLNQEQGETLVKDLAYIYQLESADTVTHLQAFINKVNSLVSSGTLSPEIGQSMVNSINEVIRNI